MSEQLNISGLLQSFAQVTYRKTMPCISNHASHWLPTNYKGNGNSMGSTMEVVQTIKREADQKELPVISWQ